MQIYAAQRVRKRRRFTALHSLFPSFRFRFKGFSIPEIPHPYDIVSRIAPATRQSLTASLFLTALTLALYHYLLSPTGYLARRDIGKLIQAKEEAIAQIGRENLALAARTQALVTDSSTIERIARDELTMIRPDETIYRIPAEGPPEYVLNFNKDTTPAM